MQGNNELTKAVEEGLRSTGCPVMICLENKKNPTQQRDRGWLVARVGIRVLEASCSGRCAVRDRSDSIPSGPSYLLLHQGVSYVCSSAGARCQVFVDRITCWKLWMSRSRDTESGEAGYGSYLVSPIILYYGHFRALLHATKTYKVSLLHQI